MKLLLIGGTGTISMAVTQKIIEQGHELFLVNRGSRNKHIDETKVNYTTCDINDENKLATLIDGLSFDAVADFIAFKPEHVERDYRLFKDKTKQFIFISSASVYQTPLANCVVSEQTPLSNPYWEYSRNKIACENYLMKKYNENGFPVTIVRPSHTYDERSLPLAVRGRKGSWQVVKRILEDKPVIVHGDGESLWTLTYNKDFAKGFVGLMGNKKAIGEAVHITSDELLTWNQIYKLIAAALGKEVNIVHVASELLMETTKYDLTGTLLGDKANTIIFDNTKIKQLVPSFEVTIMFEQGVKKVIETILTDKSLQIEDPEFNEWCDNVVKIMQETKQKIKTIY